jgi:hypothetical protein
MIENGDGDKPIWFSELAWNALPTSFTGLPPYGRVTEDQQARYTVRALTRIQEEWPWAGVSFIWFLRRANDSEKAQPMYYFRLLEPDFTPLPVYNAIRDAAPSFNVLRRGWHAADHWAIARTGAWSDAELETPADLRRAQPDLPASLPGLQATAGATASFTFTGNDLSIIAHGPGRLYVDVPGSLLPRGDNGRAYVDVPATASQINLVRGLPSASHTATLTVGEGQIALAEIIVDHHDSLPLSLLLAAAAFTIVWATAWRLHR